MTYNTLNNQTYFDIAIQLFGDASFAMDIALANGSTTVTDNPVSPVELPALELTSNQEKTVQYFNKSGISPAGALPV